MYACTCQMFIVVIKRNKNKLDGIQVLNFLRIGQDGQASWLHVLRFFILFGGYLDFCLIRLKLRVSRLST